MQADNDGFSPLHVALQRGHLGVVKLFMQGPLCNVASAESLLDPRLQLKPHVVEFLEALVVLNSKDEVLAWVIDQCSILPAGAHVLLGWFGSD